MSTVGVMSRMSTMQGQYRTPLVFINSNSHATMQPKANSSTELQTVNRSLFPDLTILEINVAYPTVVNILDDKTVKMLDNLFNKKLQYLSKFAEKPNFNKELVNILNQAEKVIESSIQDIITNDLISQLDSLIDDLSNKIIAGKDLYDDFVDENGYSIIDQIKDRIHFIDVFIKESMIKFNFYSRDNLSAPMLKIFFSGDELTAVDANWRITAKELYNVSTTIPINIINGIPDLIRQAHDEETQYIVDEETIDLLRFLPQGPQTRQGSSRIEITNENILQNLYERGYRKVIIFNNSCASVFNDGSEVTDLRKLRPLIRDAIDIRKQSNMKIKEIHSLRPDSIDLKKYNSLKNNLSNLLISNNYIMKDAAINPNIGRKGGKSKSKKFQRMSKRRNNRKTYKKKVRKTKRRRY